VVKLTGDIIDDFFSSLFRKF